MLNDPSKVKFSVSRAGRQAISQKVVKPVRVQLAGNDSRKIAGHSFAIQAFIVDIVFKENA